MANSVKAGVAEKMAKAKKSVLDRLARAKIAFKLFVLTTLLCGKTAAEATLQNQNPSRESYSREQFPFMLLPREIRDMIFEHLLPRNKNITIKCEATTLIYSQYYTPISMDIFKVSRRLRDEAYTALFRNNRVAIEYHVESHVQQMKYALMMLGYHYVHRIHLQHHADLGDADHRYVENERKYFALTSMVVSCPNLHQIDINPNGPCWLLCSMTLQIENWLRVQRQRIVRKDFSKDRPVSHPNIRIRTCVDSIPLSPHCEDNLRVLAALETALADLKQWMDALGMTSIELPHGPVAH